MRHHKRRQNPTTAPDTDEYALGTLAAPNLPSSVPICPLCRRQVPLTFHHLIPRKLHRRNYFKKHYSRVELNQGINICRPCHSGLHKLYDEMTLGKQFNTLHTLLKDEAVLRHCAWVAKQKQG